MYQTTNLINSYYQIDSTLKQRINQVLDHEIHGDYAIAQVLNQIETFHIDDTDWNNVLTYHNATFKAETLNQDIELRYDLNLNNPVDIRKYRWLNKSLKQCNTSLIVLEPDIYRYRELTDYETASILVDMQTIWHRFRHWKNIPIDAEK